MPVLLPNVIRFGKAVKVIHEVHHFFILLVIVEGNDRDAIVNLEGKTVHAIINNHNILEVPASKNTQILHVISFLRQEAMLPIQSMAHVLAIWIDVVEDSVSVGLVTCRESNNLEVFIRLL